MDGTTLPSITSCSPVPHSHSKMSSAPSPTPATSASQHLHLTKIKLPPLFVHADHLVLSPIDTFKSLPVATPTTLVAVNSFGRATQRTTPGTHIRATKAQVAALLDVFELQTIMPPSLMQEQLANRLGMSRKAVRNWFQNQRAKVRRLSSAENHVSSFTDSPSKGFSKHSSGDLSLSIFPGPAPAASITKETCRIGLMTPVSPATPQAGCRRISIEDLII